jgi:hypothetical protein
MKGFEKGALERIGESCNSNWEWGRGTANRLERANFRIISSKPLLRRTILLGAGLLLSCRTGISGRQAFESLRDGT